MGSTPARPTIILDMNQALRAEMPKCFFIFQGARVPLVTIHVTIRMTLNETLLLRDEAGRDGCCAFWLFSLPCTREFTPVLLRTRGACA